MCIAKLQLPYTLENIQEFPAMTIYHNHHIIPRHMGGTDDPSNIVKLTVEEHAEAHRKLYEEHGLKEDWLAWKGLLGIFSKQDILYELKPWNKIHDTFNLECEFCNSIITLRSTKENKKKKTCGSKSCAGKWSVKYKNTANIIPGHNKINNTFIWKCEECGTTEERRNTANNRKKRFCNKSCAASFSNKTRSLSHIVHLDMP